MAFCTNSTITEPTLLLLLLWLFCGCNELTGDGIYKVVKLPLEYVQSMLQDLLKVGLAQCNEVQLLLHCTAYGRQHQLCICEPIILVVMRLGKNNDVKIVGNG